VHALLGVGESTVALREAGNGFLTKIVGAAAKFVLCTAGLQGASTRRDVGEDEHGRATSERTTTTGITITNNTHAGTQVRANANERTDNNSSNNDN
jgi:hypothetical protein